MVQAEQDQIIGLSNPENDEYDESADYDDNQQESILFQLNGTNELQNETEYFIKKEPMFSADSNKKLR